jgi:putative flippase GtrA
MTNGQKLAPEFFRLIRFGIVAFVSNLIAYLLYIVLTLSLGLDPKLALTVCWVITVVNTFVLQRRWTFKVEATNVQWRKYFLLYLLVYILNVLALLLFVDALHWPHTIVQLALTFLLAVLSYLLQRNWVFRTQINQST